jgi:HEAT repeat protein
MMPEKRIKVLAHLNGASSTEANGAARAIWEDPDPALVRPVISVLHKGRRVYNRIEAAYALGVLNGAASTIALEQCLSNKSESSRVRALAAEALVTSHRNRSHSVLLRNLKDSSAEVRFWCAYALLEIQERKAVATLLRLAEHDNRVVKGWWSVSKEARDAIANIKRSRRRRCISCGRFR